MSRNLQGLVHDPGFVRTSCGCVDRLLVPNSEVHVNVIVWGVLNGMPGSDGWFHVGAPGVTTFVEYRFSRAVQVAKNLAETLTHKKGLRP